MWDRRASPPALTPLPGACPAGDGRGLTWVTLGWCQARRGCLQPDQSQAGHQSSHRRMHRPHLPSPATARDTPSSTHPPTDTDTGLKTPGRQTQLPRPTHTHTQTLARQTCLENSHPPSDTPAPGRTPGGHVQTSHDTLGSHTSTIPNPREQASDTTHTGQQAQGHVVPSLTIHKSQADPDTSRGRTYQAT